MDELTGDEVRRFRRELALSQRELAERLGVHLQTVSKWERGALGIAHKEVLRMALQRIREELEAERPPVHRGRPRRPR